MVDHSRKIIEFNHKMHIIPLKIIHFHAQNFHPSFRRRSSSELESRPFILAQNLEERGFSVEILFLADDSTSLIGGERVDSHLEPISITPISVWHAP